MEITEKVAYLKGLAEGMELDTEKKEGKLLAAIIDVLDDIALEIADMKADQEERDAISCRSRILHFGDETIHGVRHTKEHFDQILRDITTYERYCDNHPNFENNTTVLTSKRIKDIYEDCLEKADFL